MKIGNCPNCKRDNTRITKGVCHNCYRKTLWNRSLIECKRCHQNRPHQAHDLCPGCYNFVFHLDKVKESNQMKYHKIDYKTYKKITEKCVVCGFDKVVDLHHLDENRKNNLDKNLVGLCPNHHKMFHDFRYRKEIREDLIKKGFNVPRDLKLDFSLS